MRKRRLPALLTLVLLAGTLSTADSIRTGAPAAAAPAPAPGFVDEVVLSGLDLPTDLEFAPDGSVFVAEKRGVIKRWDSLASPTPTIYADLRTEVFNNADRGLIGLAVDPGYPAKPDVYAAFVLDQAPTGPTTVPRYGTAGEDSDPCASTCPSTGRVVRLSGVSTSSSETVLVEGWCENFYSHTIDDVEVGPDGYLYVSAGDGASADFADIGGANDACGDPVGEGGALRAQDLQTTGDPVGLDGTIIRVDTTTGAGAPSNPVASSADPNARRILASGARNPIRMTFRPGTNELYIADNGWNTWEEVNRVGNVTDGLLRNFGWPCYEGNAPQDVYVAAGAPICAALTTSAVSNPVFTYNHADNVFPSSHCAPNGSSNSAIAFYAGGTYPGRFTNALFIGDYARGCITAVLAGPDGKPDFSTMEDLVVHADNPVDLEVGPGGDLFYVDVIRGAVHRIRWVGIPDAPVAVVTPATTTGSVPLHIDFNASASHDPASLALTYAWDLDGDGTFDDATGATTSWNYEYPLSTFARVRVTNSAGSSDIGSVVINATGAPSTPGRLVPSPDAPIAFGNAETSTSVARAVRFHNFGGSAVTVTGATASGPGYTVSSPALPAIVPPGGRIDLTATFSPLGVGAAAGAITLVHTGGVGPAVVSLSGTGTACSTRAPSARTSPITTA